MFSSPKMLNHLHKTAKFENISPKETVVNCDRREMVLHATQMLLKPYWFTSELLEKRLAEQRNYFLCMPNSVDAFVKLVL